MCFLKNKLTDLCTVLVFSGVSFILCGSVVREGDFSWQLRVIPLIGGSAGGFQTPGVSVSKLLEKKLNLMFEDVSPYE